MSYREVFDNAIGTSPPTRVDLDAVIRRQRRAAVVRPVLAAAVAVTVVTVGVATATGLAGDDRAVQPAEHIVDGFPEYRDGNRVIAATSGPLADDPAEQQLELTFVPSTAEPLIYWRCDTNPSWWDHLTSSAPPGLYASEVEVRVNGRVFYTLDGTMCGTSADTFPRPDVAPVAEVNLRIGEPNTVTVTMTGPFTEIDGRTPVEVPPRTEWGIAVAEPVPLEEYVFPPRPDPLPELRVPEDGSHVVLVRSDPDDPNRSVRQRVERRLTDSYAIQVGAQTPGELAVFADDVEVARIVIWDYQDHCVDAHSLDWSDLREAGLEALPGEEVTITVQPQRMTGDWYLRLNAVGAIHCEG